MGTVDLFIPWGGPPAARDDRAHGLEIVVGWAYELWPDWYREISHWHGCRAKTCNYAAAESSADVIVFIDADSIVHPSQLDAAVAWVRENGGGCRAYTTYKRLSKVSSDDCRGWGDVFTGDVVWSQEGTVSHGAVAFDRQTFCAHGGYDPRFLYWYEDSSFDLINPTMPWGRIAGDLFHLWHEPQSVPDADEALWTRYHREPADQVRAEVGFPS